MPAYGSVDEYIGSFPEPVRDILRQVRRAILRAAPGAEETISYQIPTLRLGGRFLVSFAGWKHHIAVYPVPEMDDALAGEIAAYRTAKGTLRFPLGRPIPYELIERVAVLLVRQRS